MERDFRAADHRWEMRLQYISSSVPRSQTSMSDSRYWQMRHGLEDHAWDLDTDDDLLRQMLHREV